MRVSTFDFLYPNLVNKYISTQLALRDIADDIGLVLSSVGEPISGLDGVV